MISMKPTSQRQPREAIVGIGIPGCGKTTILKPLAGEKGLLYINADDLREEVTGDPADHSKDRLVWKKLYQKIEDGLKDKGVVVDVTNTKKRDRRQMVDYLKQNGTDKITGYWVKAPLDACLRRNKRRSRVVPGEALSKMQRRLELNPPSVAEGFDELKIIDAS
jgi:predicted kinase